MSLSALLSTEIIKRKHKERDRDRDRAKFSAMANYDNLFKIVVIGDPSAPRKQIVQAITDNKNEEIGEMTYFDSKIGNRTFKLQFWIPETKENIFQVRSSYYRGANAVIFVFDNTNKKSFDNLINWNKDVENSAPKEVIKFIFITGLITSPKIVSDGELRECGKKIKAEICGFWFNVPLTIGLCLEVVKQKLLDMYTLNGNPPEINEQLTQISLSDYVLSLLSK